MTTIAAPLTARADYLDGEGYLFAVKSTVEPVTMTASEVVALLADAVAAYGSAIEGATFVAVDQANVQRLAIEVREGALHVHEDAWAVQAHRITV